MIIDQFNFEANLSASDVFSSIAEQLALLNLKIVAVDFERPWGGFFVLDESQIDLFAQVFFPELGITESQKLQKLSPKILVVEPGKRLSWQYHHRRAEIWRNIGLEAAVSLSPDDTEREKIILQKGQTIVLKTGQRHRLIGQKNWGVVAEIWEHVDPQNPSNEADIIRLQDDFGRKS